MDVFERISLGEYSLEQTSVISAVEMHTGGEPTRIVVRGYPHLEGDTLLEKRAYAREKLDEIRRRLMLEPRGHKEMYGAILVPETERTRIGEADVGVLFCHNEGYSTMCGHATLALGRLLVDTEDEQVFPRRRQIHFDGSNDECRLRLHAPCGVVEVTVPIIRQGNRVRSDPGRNVRFVSVRSFAAAVDVTVEVPEELRWPELQKAGKHAVKVDIAYGGAFYVIVQEKELGFEHVRNGVDLKRLDAATAALKRLVGARKDLFRGHGLEAELEYLYGVIVVDEGEGQVGLGGLDDGRVGVCFFADQQIDRSPTGSGVSARVALARAKGLLGDGERVRFDSLLSADATRPDGDVEGGAAGAFVGSAVPGGRVVVEGRAFYTGASVFVAEDAFSRGGFLV
ncbi:Diaminopimelate epimerase-like protein [Trametes punicea]|nr:Diaminopimelate epimerase-like protein [Trametes punicea]